MFVKPPHAPGRCLIPLTDVLFFALILEYDRRGRAAGGGDHAQTDDVPREASSSPAIPISLDDLTRTCGEAHAGRDPGRSGAY